MIGYVTLGSNDLVKAGAFYDALLGELGATRMMDEDTFIAWSTNPKAPALSIIKPFDGKPASVGNGVMVALSMSSMENVNSFHAKALALGATDEGAPGPRGSGGFYGAYFRDLDGNKLAAFCYSSS